jgi:hypothetical protein
VCERERERERERREEKTDCVPVTVCGLVYMYSEPRDILPHVTTPAALLQERIPAE